MPTQVVPVITGIVAVFIAFIAFIIAVGWAALKTALPRHGQNDRA